MPGMTRLGDKGQHLSGNCSTPHTAISASTDVFCNGIGAQRIGDKMSYHCKHHSELAEGSTNVFVNGIPVGRLGDSVACGSTMITSSTDVFVNDGGED